MNISLLMPTFHKGRCPAGRFLRAPFLALAPFVLALSACAPSFPPIAAGAPSDAAFKAGIATRFPPGTRATVLRRELAADGFSFLDDPVTRRHSALFKGDNLPCYSQVRVDWTEDHHGRIAEIQAARFDCS